MARLLLGVYAGLVVYATLYPMAGWRDPGLSPFAYLSAPWPRYVTRFDVAVNVLGYVPFGFLAAAALHPRLRGVAAFALAAGAAAALAMLLEAAQSYLPARIASNLDVLCNLGGATAGAALALRYAPRLVADGPLRHWRHRTFVGGAPGDAGLVLMGLWLFVQLDPTTLLFGAGDLNDYFDPQEFRRGYPPQFFVMVEAVTVAANLIAVALVLSLLTTPSMPVRLHLVALLAVALGVRTAAFAVLMRAENVFAWLTPGAQAGLIAGLAAAFGAVALPRVARLAAAAVLVMATTVLVNLAPPNPYFAASLKVWQQGHFLNFNGLTRLVSAAWPFAALAYLMVLAARRGRE